MAERVWDKFLTPQDKAHLAQSHHRTVGFGQKPALLLIALSRWVSGDEPQALLFVLLQGHVIGAVEFASSSQFGPFGPSLDGCGGQADPYSSPLAPFDAPAEMEVSVSVQVSYAIE